MNPSPGGRSASSIESCAGAVEAMSPPRRIGGMEGVADPTSERNGRRNGVKPAEVRSSRSGEVRDIEDRKANITNVSELDTGIESVDDPGTL